MLQIFAVQPILPRGLHERVKERVDGERLRLVFRVKLAGDEIRVDIARQFYYLDKFFVRRYAAENEAFPLKHTPEFRVEFVAVAVAFADPFCPVIYVASDRAFLQITIPCTETH